MQCDQDTNHYYATSSSLAWANFIKQILDRAGFSFVWLNPASVDPQQMKERLTDQYTQDWQSKVRATAGKLRTHKLIKEDLKRERATWNYHHI